MRDLALFSTCQQKQSLALESSICARGRRLRFQFAEVQDGLGCHRRLVRVVVTSAAGSQVIVNMALSKTVWGESVEVLFGWMQYRRNAILAV